MKKIIVMIIVVVTLTSLVGCGNLFGTTERSVTVLNGEDIILVEKKDGEVVKKGEYNYDKETGLYEFDGKLVSKEYLEEYFFNSQSNFP